MVPQGATSAEREEHPVEPLRSVRTDVRPRHNLPLRPTSFVGRAMELEELAELLAAPDCRLLTIIGPGGIGKTRLALEAAEAALDLCPDGVAVVELQSVSEIESIAPAVANAIGCALIGHGDARDQVARFLHPLRLLLVLDNFEHLLGQADWLGELLAAAPGLRMLVTSREALNLAEEWRYPLAGLAPPDGTVDDLGAFDAVRLFVERAQQVRRSFSLEPEREGVVRLCGITEGLPLALELAAAWTRTLPCAAIADEIERNMAFLSSDLRNVLARHRSMQAAFHYSWALLTEDERRVFRRLSVFRGGFDREAAERVAGATLPLLSSLVDKSLVRLEADGRFVLHELLRQYADEHLRAVADEAARTDRAHRDYYLAFVASRFDLITGADQRTALSEIAAELDNIRAALRNAVSAGDIEALGRSYHTLTLFYDFRARYPEGVAMLEEGLEALRSCASSGPVDEIIAGMLVDAVRMYHRRGRLSDMHAALAESEERYARLSVPPPRGLRTDPRGWRAVLELIDGNYAGADRIAAGVVQGDAVSDRMGDYAFAWWTRAAAALWRDHFDAAGEHARRSVEAALAIGDRWELAYAHNMQGHVATARGEYADARRHYEAGFAIRAEFDDPEGMGTGLAHLAKVAALQGNWAEAEQLNHRSLEIARDIGDLVTMGWALNGLGGTACAIGDVVAAGRYFAEGMRLVSEARFIRLTLVFLVSAGDWLHRTGHPVEAVEPLALAQIHPASDHETRARASQVLAALEQVLSPEVFEAAAERGRNFDPAILATHLAEVLTSSPVETPTADEEPSAGGSPSATPELVEPLTERELDVLRLIAAGHSNREIADELFLSVNTVRSYSQQLYGKLGVGSRTQAVARAREIGLLT